MTHVMLVAGDAAIFEKMCAQLSAEPPQDAEVLPDDVRELPVVLRFSEVADVDQAVKRAANISDRLSAQLELPSQARIRLGLRTTFGKPEQN